MLKRWTTLLAAGSLLWSPVAGAELIERNAIVAVVNDAVITFQELDDFTGSAVDLLRRTFRNQPDVLNERYVETIKDGLDQLITRQLILEEFKTLGGVLDETIIDDEIKDRIRRQYGDRARLTQTLQQRGVTYESFRAKTREEIIINYMRNRNVSAALIISPAKIERYYTNHLDSYQLGEQVKLRMITLNRPATLAEGEVAQLALEIRRKIQEGASFAEMASVYSEGSTRREGGDWDWVERSKLSPGLSDVAFELKAQEMSDVLALAREPEGEYWILHYDAAGALQRGRKYTARDVFLQDKSFVEDPAATRALPAPQEFYLMLVEARREPRTRPLDEVREDIEKDLLAEERARLEKKWVNRLMEKSYVKRF